MLPFMKETEGQVEPGQPPEGQPGSAGTLPGSQEFLTVADRGKNVRNSTMFVAILFGLGVLGVWFMVQKTKPSAAAAAEIASGEAEIEVAISRLTGVSTEMMTRMDEVVNKFYEFSEVHQVQVNELCKNPFALETSATEVPEKEAEDKQSEEEKVRKALAQQMAGEAKVLSLVGIMEAGNGHRCMIGDDILSQGDTAGAFKVVSIRANAVELEWIPVGVDLSLMKADDTRITLKLAE